MKWIFLKKIKDEKGQALVEFALVVIIFLVIFFAIVEFGRAWFRLDTLKNAANIAARTYAVATQNKETAGRAAADKVEAGMGAKATFLPTTTFVRVTVRESFSTAVPGLPVLLNITSLRRDATYRLEK